MDKIGKGQQDIWGKILTSLKSVSLALLGVMKEQRSKSKKAEVTGTIGIVIVGLWRNKAVCREWSLRK